MCIEFSLLVLNGFCNEKESSAFTFVSPNGNSTNDYFIASDDFLTYVMILPYLYNLI